MLDMHVHARCQTRCPPVCGHPHWPSHPVVRIACWLFGFLQSHSYIPTAAAACLLSPRSRKRRRPGDLCPGSQLSQPALHRAAGARSKVLLPTGVPLDRWLHYTSHVCLQNGCCLRQGVGMGGPDEGPGVKPPSQHLAAQASVTPPTQLHTHWCSPHTESGSHPMHTLPPHLHTGWPRHPPRTPIHMHSHSCASETRLITEQMPVKAKTSVQTKIPVGGPP